MLDSLRRFLRSIFKDLPNIEYRPILSSSGLYLCHGCHGMNDKSAKKIIHLPSCPHYPSRGNRELEKRLKAQGLFSGSKWDPATRHKQKSWREEP